MVSVLSLSFYHRFIRQLGSSVLQSELEKLEAFSSVDT